jgi:anti-sigma B factor antagonist
MGKTMSVIKPSPFEIRSELGTDTARLTVFGELDMATVPQLEDGVRGMLAGGVRELIIDLGKVRFIDSSGLRLLIILRDRAAAEGWTLGLLRPSGEALAIFGLTGADENLPFVEDPR